uniref:SCA7 domain-containing protein n=1 Tax=Pseudonaja textilis TaxID=8673 RepID=A0A670ZVI8_PSETE
MAVRGRAAVVAAVAMAAVDRRLPNLDDFAGQSWSAWVERVGPPTTETGELSDLEENSRNGRKKIDAMTLIKEDMSIFGHCPAHDEFYLVVCNHCGQVVKPQAFQKHCERRHGPLSKLCGRVQPSSNLQKCHAVNGRPIVGGNHGSTKSWREKSQSFFNQTQHTSGNSKEVLGKPSLLASTKELASAKAGSTSVITVDTLNRKLENASSLSEKESGVVKSLKKISRKECDLNRQCGVVNPETKKVCTRLLTCKIHSVHQRREVQGRTKDFDVLVAELKASTKKGECPKDKSPVRKDIATERLLQDFSSMSQTSLVLTNVSTSSCHTKQPYSHCALSRGCSLHDCCYVFSRRLDRFCSALSSMLERHLSSHMWNNGKMLQRLKGSQNNCSKAEKLYLPSAIKKSPSNNRSLVHFHIECCSTSHSSFMQNDSFTLCQICENLRELSCLKRVFHFHPKQDWNCCIVQFCISLTEMASENIKGYLDPWKQTGISSIFLVFQ